MKENYFKKLLSGNVSIGWIFWVIGILSSVVFSSLSVIGFFFGSQLLGNMFLITIVLSIVAVIYLILTKKSISIAKKVAFIFLLLISIPTAVILTTFLVNLILFGSIENAMWGVIFLFQIISG